MPKQREIVDRLEHGASILTLCDSGQWEARTIHADAMAASRRLAAAGIEFGHRVAVISDTSYDWVTLDLALHRLGASILGVPRELASASPAELADHFDLSLVLTTRPITPADAALGHVSPLTWSEAAAPRARRARRGALPREGGLTFSSGSTGTPKCIVGVESSFDDLLGFLGQLVRDPRQDALLMFLPYSGYHSRAYTAAALYLGMDVCLATPAAALDAFAAFRPTICHAPPVFYDTVARRIRGSELPPREAARAVLGGRTRLLFTGMSPVSRETLEYLDQAGVAVFNAYGSMEAGMVSMCLPGANRLGSVGKPLRAGGMRLADDGEIVISREAPPILGCLDDRGELVPVTPGAIHTGDLGRFDEDGYLWILGRKSNLMILATGQKVQAEQVEAELESDVRIRKATVFGEGAAFLTAVFSVAVDDDHTRAAIEARIAEFNRGAGDNRPRIERWVVTDVEYTIDNGLLTPELQKPLRRAIEARFVRAASGAGGGGDAGGELGPEATTVLRAWRGVLGTEAGLDTNFFDAGGSSLVLVQLVAELERATGRALSAQDVYGNPTPRALARLVAGRAPSNARAAGLTMAELVADIERHGLVEQVAMSPSLAPAGSAIVLTGATGYLGAHVLAQLVAQGARVRCLVRGDRERVHAALRTYALDPDGAHVTVVRARLDAPDLGLDARARAALADGASAVIHCAADVNFLLPYDQLRVVNAEGTASLARFAAAAGLSFHHVSTLGVMQQHAASELEETTDLAFAGALVGGYAQSKWAGEYVVRRLGARGLDVTVYRPGEILASARSGRWNARDFIAQILATAARLGAAPEIDASLVGADVDYVASAIAHLAVRRDRGELRTVHLAPHRVAVHELYDAMRSAGATMRTVPVAEWTAALTGAQRRGELAFKAVPLVFASGGWDAPGDWIRRLHSEQSADMLAHLDPALTSSREAAVAASARAALALTPP